MIDVKETKAHQKELEKNLKLGDSVMVNYKLNNKVSFTAPAKIIRINPKSYALTLKEDVRDTKLILPAGSRLNISKTVSNNWTTTKCIISNLHQDLTKGAKLVAPSHDKDGVQIYVKGNHVAEAEGKELVINAEASEQHCETLSKINQSAGNGVAFNCSTIKTAEIDNFMEKGGEIKNSEVYHNWKKLVNMSAKELQDFLNTPEGKKAGLSKSEAKEQGIKSGQESAEWIIKMKNTPVEKWTDKMWDWAKRQVSFIKRMSKIEGPLFDEKGNKTRKHTALLIWGHNPEKKQTMEKGGEILSDTEIEVGDRIYQETKDKGGKSVTQGIVYYVSPNQKSFKLKDDFGNLSERTFQRRDFIGAEIIKPSPSQKDKFIEIAKSEKDVEKAFEKSRLIKDVDEETAEWFANTYNPTQKLSFQESYTVFWDEVNNKYPVREEKDGIVISREKTEEGKVKLRVADGKNLMFFVYPSIFYPHPISNTKAKELFNQAIDRINKKQTDSSTDKKTPKRSIELDKKYKALPPGKRISKDGNIYYETRPNRSDMDRRKKLNQGGDIENFNTEAFTDYAHGTIKNFLTDDLGATLNKNWEFSHNNTTYSIQPYIVYKKGNPSQIQAAEFEIKNHKGQKVGFIDFTTSGHFVPNSKHFGWTGKRLENGGEIQSIKKFVDTFPDNPKSWAEATDELADLHNRIAQDIPGYKGHIFEKDGGTMPNNVRTLEVRNKYHKQQIKKLLPKLSKQDLEQIHNQYKQWFKLENGGFTYASGGKVLSNSEIIGHIDFEDQTDIKQGLYSFSFETIDSEGAPILDYDGVIQLAPETSTRNYEVEWGQNTPEDWETAETYVLDKFYEWKNKLENGGEIDDTIVLPSLGVEVNPVTREVYPIGQPEEAESIDDVDYYEMLDQASEEDKQLFNSVMKLAKGGPISSGAMASKLLKRTLKEKFPNVKFSVRYESFSGGDAIRVSWNFGPTVQEVDVFADQYEAGKFNGMEDIYEYDPNRGEHTVKYVTTSRKYQMEGHGEYTNVMHDYITVKMKEKFNQGNKKDWEFDRDMKYEATKIMAANSFDTDKVFSFDGLVRTDVESGSIEDLYLIKYNGDKVTTNKKALESLNYNLQRQASEGVRELQEKEWEEARKEKQAKLTLLKPKVYKVIGDVFIDDAIFPSINKNGDLEDYIKYYNEDLEENNIKPTKVKVEQVIISDQQEWDLITTSFLDSFDFWNKVGGSEISDELAEEYKLNESGFNFGSWDETQRKIWAENSYRLVTLVYNKDTQQAIVVNTEGYDYARYVGFVFDKEAVQQALLSIEAPEAPKEAKVFKMGQIDIPVIESTTPAEQPSKGKAPWIEELAPKPKILNGYSVQILRPKGQEDDSYNTLNEFSRVVLVTDGISGDSSTVAEDEVYVKLVKRIISGEAKLSAQPVNAGGNMFGGSFVWSADSRFRDEVSEQPIPLHDRVELEKGGEINYGKVKYKVGDAIKTKNPDGEWVNNKITEIRERDGWIFYDTERGGSYLEGEFLAKSPTKNNYGGALHPPQTAMVEKMLMQEIKPITKANLITFYNKPYHITNITEEGVLITHTPELRSQEPETLFIYYDELLQKMNEGKLSVSGFSSAKEVGIAILLNNHKNRLNQLSGRLLSIEQAEALKALQQQQEQAKKQEQELMLQRKRLEAEARVSIRQKQKKG